MAHAKSNSRSLAVDYLHGQDDVKGMRLAYRPVHKYYEKLFFLVDVSLYWEVSMNTWEVGENNTRETNYAVAVSPVFSKELTKMQGRYPLSVELGIGISAVADTRFAGRNIGSSFQFEDRLGLSLAFGKSLKQTASLRYMHYSNGGLNEQNSGLDFVSLSYSYHF